MGELRDNSGFGRVVAVVPAKLTSVRLPRKNVADLGGYPMFYYSVRAAQLCPEIDEVYVSSESAEILDAAEAFGARTILRPAALSAPHVTNQDVLCHVLEEMRQHQEAAPELLVLLQPTHPLRQPREISEGIRRMHRDQTADTLLTVVLSVMVTPPTVTAVANGQLLLSVMVTL